MCRSFLTPAVYCLVERENVEQAEAKLAAYERSNLQDIIHNEARKVQDSIALQQFFRSLKTDGFLSGNHVQCKLASGCVRCKTEGLNLSQSRGFKAKDMSEYATEHSSGKQSFAGSADTYNCRDHGWSGRHRRALHRLHAPLSKGVCVIAMAVQDGAGEET